VFQGAANDPQEQEAACASAGAYCSKALGGASLGGAAITRIERFIQERRAGFPVDYTRLSLLDRELIVMWVECEEMLERRFKSDLTILIEVMTARMRSGI
jgi:hypothetical protein